MKISRELISGSTPMMVLSVIKSEDMYGYRIIRELETRSENAFSLKEGTLYPLLHNFERDGYLKSYWVQNAGERKRKYYSITKKGLKVLAKSKEEWKSYSTAVNKVVTGSVAKSPV